MNNKILVTGASGFIGSHCVSLLKDRGYNVYACSRKKVDNNIPGVQYILCDLEDRLSVHELMDAIKPDVLLHLAWYVEPGKYMHSAQNILWVDYSLNLFRCFAESGGKRIVSAGTCAEYDWDSLSQEGVINEEYSIQNSGSLYSASKSAIGLISTTYMNELGLSASHGRIFYLFGPGENEKRLVPETVFSILRSNPVSINNANLIRDFLYVKDVASAFVSLVESEESGIYNIGMGSGCSIYNIVVRINEILGNTGIVNCVNTENKSIPLRIVADNNRLRELGWKPAYTINEALDDYVRLLKKHWRG